MNGTRSTVNRAIRLLSSRRQGLALFLVLLACYSYFPPRWADWNQNSRLDLVVSFVDSHTLMIDRLVTNTGDYAAYGGHYYSDKAPGIALLSVPVYVAFETLVPESLTARVRLTVANASALNTTLRQGGTGLETDKVRFFAALIATALAVGALPAAILGVLFFVVAGWIGLSTRARLVATALYALATSAFPYANSLVGHQTSAFLLFAAFAILFAIRRSTLGRNWLLVAGFLIGYAALTEYQTTLIGAILALYALVTLGHWPGTIPRLALGAVPPAVALVGYDYSAFGTLLPVGYFHSALWSDVHQIGFLSLTYPHLDALFGITFGVYRGLFFLSPYLLFAGLGYVLLWRCRERRAELAVLGLAPIGFLLFNGSSAMWQGGFAVGPRYLVPSLPFLALVAGVGVSEAWRYRTLRPVLLLAGAWSFFAVWAETIGGQSFPDYTANPLFELSLPRLVAGDIARNAGMFLGLTGWLSLVPLLAVLLIIVALANVDVPPRTTAERKPSYSGQVERWA